MYYSGNGHYYEAISTPGITWTNARASAETLSYNNMKGHLATITSQDENEFITTQFRIGGYWVGGFKSVDTPSGQDPMVGWQWVTGENWGYTNWADGEPSNSYAGEQFILPKGSPESALEVWGPDRKWNDYPKNDIPLGVYIVEYETTSVPEFPSIAVPAAAILGLVVIFGRRKNIV